jgi:hypothetical protein
MKNMFPWMMFGLAVIIAVFIWSPIFGNEPAEIRIETTNVKGLSGLTYGNRSWKTPKAGTQYGTSFSKPFLEARKIYFRTVYVNMNGFYKARINLFLRGKLCGSANLVSIGVSSEHKIDCVSN